jgi:hypothetical protein
MESRSRFLDHRRRRPGPESTLRHAARNIPLVGVDWRRFPILLHARRFSSSRGAFRGGPAAAAPTTSAWAVREAANDKKDTKGVGGSPNVFSPPSARGQTGESPSEGYPLLVFSRARPRGARAALRGRRQKSEGTGPRAGAARRRSVTAHSSIWAPFRYLDVEVKWPPDLGPLVKVYGVLLCRNRWSKI